MREWRPIALSLVVMSLAYATDRLLNLAVESYGTLPEAGSAARVAVVEVVGTVSIVALVGVLASLVLRDPPSRLSRLVLIAIGAYFTLVIALGPVTRGAIAPPAAFDAYVGASHFLRWAGAAVGVIGLIALLGPRPKRWTRRLGDDTGWMAVGAVVVLLILAFLVVDPFIRALFIGWSANLEALPYVIADVAIRVALVGAVLGVALLLRGADQLIAVTMLAIGLIASIAFLVVGDPMSPALGATVRWVAGAAVVLGLWRLLSADEPTTLEEAVVG